jgi:hypothetical protein
VAALATPRPVLLANTDKDRIFPLDGVERLHWQVRHLYDLYKLPRNWGLNITEGPHMDTQELQVHSFVWMNRFVKKDEAKIETLAVPKFEREQLRVWHELPADAINRTIEEHFVPMAKAPEVPSDAAAWAKMRDHWMAELRDKSFRGWPTEGEAAALKQVESVERDGVKIAKYELISQPGVTLDVRLAHRADLEKPELVVLNVLDEKGWEEFAGSMLRGEGEGFQQQKKMFTSTKWAMAYVAPRGIGPTRWTQDKKKSTHIERRFVMLGQTADGMRVWDVRRAVEGLRGLESMKGVPVWLQAEGKMAGVALYASLFAPRECGAIGPVESAAFAHGGADVFERDAIHGCSGGGGDGGGAVAGSHLRVVAGRGFRGFRGVGVCEAGSGEAGVGCEAGGCARGAAGGELNSLTRICAMFVWRFGCGA